MNIKVLTTLCLTFTTAMALAVVNLDEENTGQAKTTGEPNRTEASKANEQTDVVSSLSKPDPATNHLQCNNLLTDKIESKLWRKTKRASIHQFFERLKNRGTDDAVIASIGLYSGLGPSRPRLLATPDRSSVAQHLYALDGFELYSATMMNTIETAIANKDEEGLAQLLLDGKLAGNKYLLGKDSLVSLLGLVYENTKDKVTAIIWMEDLIEQGAPITYWDLFYSEKNELPAWLIQKMYYASDLSPTVTFPINGYRVSLASEALFNNNYEMSKFWLELDSPAGPDYFANTGLDALVRFIGNTSPEQVNELFNLIAKQGVLPNRKSTAKAIQEVVSKADIQKYYVDISARYVDNISSVYPTAFNLLLDFYKALLGDALKEPIITYDCISTLGQDMLLSLLAEKDDELVEFATYEADVSPVKTLADRIDVLADNILLEIKGRLSDQGAILNELSKRIDIAGKLAYEKFSLALLTEEGERLSNELQAQENTEEITPLGRSLVEHVGDGNWNKAWETALLLEQLDYPALNELLMLSLGYNAPPVFIDKILSRGATLHDGFIVSLVLGNNVTQAETVKDHLNVNYIGGLGYTTVEYAGVFQGSCH